MCGACELRCPNTLFTGDFYRFRQRTIDVVKAMRTLAVQRGRPSEELEAMGRADRPVGQRAGAGLDARDIRQQGTRVGDGSGHPDRRRDRPVRGLRSGIQAPVGAALGRAAAPGIRRRVRIDGPAVVLRRTDVGDRLRRDRPQDGRAQHARLAQDAARSESSASIPHDYITIIENYPALDPNFDEFEIVARGRPDRRADPGGQAEADHPDRADRHLPRSMSAEQTAGRLAVAARDPARDPRADVRRRGPRHAVVLLLGRRLEPVGREARS